jgi:transposase-like protein
MEQARKRCSPDDGPVSIDVPRDREGTFEPQRLANTSRASRLDGGHRSGCARLGGADIQALVKDMYADDVSPYFDQRVTDVSA